MLMSYTFVCVCFCVHVFVCFGGRRHAGCSEDDAPSATFGALDQVDGRLRPGAGRHILGESPHTEALLVPQRHPHQLVPLPRSLLPHDASGESFFLFVLARGWTKFFAIGRWKLRKLIYRSS